jgi:hypothetical protein
MHNMDQNFGMLFAFIYFLEELTGSGGNHDDGSFLLSAAGRSLVC